MKRYYIDRVRTYATTINKKCDELANHVDSLYSHSLVDENSMKQIVADIKAKAKELDEQYPRTKKIAVHKINHFGGICISSNPENNPEKEIFQFTFLPVRKEFKYDSKSNTYNLIEEKGGKL